MRQPWHASSDELVQSLKTHSSDGLAGTEAKARLAQYGPNQLQEAKPRSPLAIFLEQFDDFIIWVLIGAAVVSGLMKEVADTLVILGIVVLNAVLGLIQEYRAEKSLAALKKLSSPTSRVVRDGRHSVVASSDLVPGDLIELEAGDHVPADSRLVWLTPNFATQEASLTGESTPVLKDTAGLEAGDVPLADRTNMVYLGTSMAAGKGRAIICHTGMQTELGKIAGMIQEIPKESTPLQRRLEEFGKWIVYVCFVLVALVFVLNLWRGFQQTGHITKELLVEMFLTSVSLAVAAIPEGLPAIVTIALALGVQRMAKRHAIMKKLPSVETLGCATVICSDKTGTLTRNEMTVQAVYAGGKMFRVTGAGYEPKGQFLLDDRPVDQGRYPDLDRCLRLGVLCNGAELAKVKGAYAIVGDPTEGALLTAAAKVGLTKPDLERQYPFVQEIPFDAVRKRMTVLRKGPNGTTAVVKGAPDVLLALCTAIEDNATTRPLTEKDRDLILKANSDLARQALRVLAVAYRVCGDKITEFTSKTVEDNLIFVGLMAMIDPPREEVKQAIVECRKAGLRTVMITGDHKDTAVAIARELGLYSSDSLALTGEELDRTSDAELASKIDRVRVYARVSPEHKLRVVRALRSHGQVVAMTGDGVNDAPAVKEADIGVAMGITGTDVTKEVSDMVITDDNFASIVSAVREGRGIYDNIRKFVHYLLSCNVGEILVMFVASLMGMPMPLLPIHILWVNLVTDGLPALALGVDPVDPDIMEKPPRKTDEPVVTRPQMVIMVCQGAFIAAASLAAFSYILWWENEGITRARTGAFVVLSCSQLFHAFNCRNMTKSLFKIGPFTNMNLIWANLISLGLQVGVVYIPFCRSIFKTEMLTAFDWVLVMGISSLPLWAMELVKLGLSVRRSPRSV
jgi:Ca2+-transporting ATPase